MKPLSQCSEIILGQIDYVLADIDDTLTLRGMLPAEAYAALENLQHAGFKVLPITGRPAGWCDHIARMWPVDGIVGENGAFYFHYDRARHCMIRRYWNSTEERQKDRLKMTKIAERILSEVPGAKVAADQAYREADLAIDFCEDVPSLPREDVDRIVAIFHEMGARAKVSSIHVNGWFGAFDKLAMTKILFREIFEADLAGIKERVVFAGDSPNDAPMFGFFPNAVGVANVAQFVGRMDAEPAWITIKAGGQGFAELAQVLLSIRKTRR